MGAGEPDIGLSVRSMTAVVREVRSDTTPQACSCQAEAYCRVLALVRPNCAGVAFNQHRRAHEH